MRRFAIAVAVFGMLALAPRPAHAQAFFVPFFGYDFGGDAGNCQSIVSNCSVKRTAYGFGVGQLSHGIFGGELDLSYAPDFFGASPSFGANSVLTVMGNVIIALPAGPVHPYVTAGAGIMRTHVELRLSQIFSTSDTTFGYNVGGGVMIMLPSHLGVRVDYRNIRTAGNVTIAGFSLPFSQGATLSYSRLTFGLVLH
jgi:opacity protein-like surface antigen